MKNYYVKNTSQDQALIIEEGTGRTVAVVYDPKDAALLAAAPELLEALELLTKQCDQWHSGKGAGSLSYWAGPGREAALASIIAATPTTTEGN